MYVYVCVFVCVDLCVLVCGRKCLFVCVCVCVGGQGFLSWLLLLFVQRVGVLGVELVPVLTSRRGAGADGMR